MPPPPPPPPSHGARVWLETPTNAYEPYVEGTAVGGNEQESANDRTAAYYAVGPLASHARLARLTLDADSRVVESGSHGFVSLSARNARSHAVPADARQLAHGNEACLLAQVRGRLRLGE